MSLDKIASIEFERLELRILAQIIHLAKTRSRIQFCYQVRDLVDPRTTLEQRRQLYDTIWAAKR